MRTYSKHMVYTTEKTFGSPLIGRSYEADTSNGYRFAFNGMEKTDEIYGDGNGLDFGARILDARLGRWQSVDPLLNKYPNMSPYAFGLNSPILVIDCDGRENIIYLVVLPSAKGEFSKQDCETIRDKANVSLEAMGINAKVVIWEPKVPGETFNKSLLATSDHFAALGEKKEVSEFMAQQGQIAVRTEKLTECDNGRPCPEISETPGNSIALSSKDIACESILQETKANKNTYAAFCILHGLGHNAGIEHPSNLMHALIMEEGQTIMNDLRGLGGAGQPLKSEYKSLEDYMNNNPEKGVPYPHPRNEEYVEALNKEFKSKEEVGEPADNYGKLKTDFKGTTDTNNTDKTSTKKPLGN